MKKTIIFILTLSIMSAAYSQGSIDMPTVIPSSPNVASLSKFGDYPVSLYTGTVGISADLFQIPLKNGLDLNISLDYHSSGIKVREAASWVGVGWALSAGGCISRDIRDKADETSGGFYTYIRDHIGYTFPNTLPHGIDNNTELLYGRDTEPDIFTYNFNGRTGKFFINNYGICRTMPHSDIKIIINSNFGEWKIIDENGFTYVFGISEYTETNPDMLYPTAWWLTGIISPEGKELVKFEYTNTKIVDTSIPYESFHFITGGNNEGYDQGEYYTTTRSYTYTGNNLSKIIIPGKGYLSLSVDNALTLASIKQYSEQSVLQKEYAFEYYTDSGRRYLSKIKQKSGGQENLYRQFSYYPGLPDRLSKSQDPWGYFNAVNNSTLLPYLGLSINYQSGTRTTNENAVAGTIKDIIYPTGGYTQFTFENNVIPTSLSSPEPTELVRRSGTLSINRFGEDSLSFSTEACELEADFEYALTYAGTYTVELSLINMLNGNSLLHIQGSQTSSYLVSSDGSFHYYKTGSKFYIAKGNYKWIVKITKTEISNQVKPASVTFRYYEKSAQPPHINPNERVVGGLRIAKITNYDENNQILSSTQYKYKDKTGKCSGILSAEPNFFHDYSFCECIGMSQHICIRIIEKRIINDADQNQIIGPPVQYHYVSEEKMEGNNPVIRTDYRYSTFTPQKQGIPVKPSVQISLPYSVNDYSGGLLLEREDYKKTDGNFLPVRLEKNLYGNKESGDLKFQALHIEKYLNECGLPIHNLYVWGYYDIIAGKTCLLKNTVTEYFYKDSGSKDSIVTVKDYAYDENKTYIQPVSISLKDSRNQTVETQYTYCYDENNSVNQDMTEKNRIAQPVRVQKKTNGQQVELAKYYFGYFNNNSIIELDSIACQQSNTSDLDTRIIYHNYDSYGNPVYLSKDDATKVVYLWSYKGQYPVAEIQIGNHTFAQVEAAVKSVFSVTSIDALSQQTTPNEAILKNGTLQNALPKALVTTYSYKPMVGMTSATDPRGVTIYYDYDDFGRLKESYYKEGNTRKSIEKYDYHYKQ